MKIERLFIYCLLVGTSFLSSCSNEEMTDNPVETLPEGMYPLTFTATQGEVVASPQTRVSDYDNEGTHKSKWDTGDQIKVTVKENSTGTEATTTCTLNESGNITSYNPQLYWQTTGNHTINAWYSNIKDQSPTATNTVSLTDQSSGLAYVLKADQLTDKNYKSENIALAFKHQLAKVRVKVVKGTYTGNLNVTAVSVNGYTSCNVSDGSVSQGGNRGSIQMKHNGDYWEANLVPGEKALGNTVTIEADDKTTTCTLASAVTLTAAQMYTCMVTVMSKNYTPDNLPNEITEGEYTISGTGTKTITINGSPKVTLNNVTITNDNIPIRIISGNPTLIVNGETTLTSTNSDAAGIQLEGESTHVKIQGKGTLVIKNKGAGIGSKKGGTCGNIHIDGITVKIETKEGAGIGGGDTGNCGDIKIENTDITIKKPEGSAAIGCGASIAGWVVTKCGNIEISNSNVVATVGNYYAAFPAAIGCCGAFNDSTKGNCGNITIKLKDGQTKDYFLSQLTIPSNTADKVGLGYNETDRVLKGKVGIITWKKEDGTIIETTSARDE